MFPIILRVTTACDKKGVEKVGLAQEVLKDGVLAARKEKIVNVNSCGDGFRPVSFLLEVVED